MEAGKPEALNSLEELKKAAMELGYTEEQVEEAVQGFEGFPMDDEDLEEITGGLKVPISPTKLNGCWDL